MLDVRKTLSEIPLTFEGASVKVFQSSRDSENGVARFCFSANSISNSLTRREFVLGLRLPPLAGSLADASNHRAEGPFRRFSSRDDAALRRFRLVLPPGAMNHRIARS